MARLRMSRSVSALVVLLALNELLNTRVELELA